MKTFFAICCLLKVTLALAAEINIEGTEGGDVSFKCSHKLASNNKKYFCKNPCHSEDILVTVSPGEKAESGRITLVDHEDGSFTVTIKHLQLSDSHMYWCTVIRSMGKTYTSVDLTVYKAVLKKTVPPTVSSPWFPDSTTSSQMTNSMRTNTTRNISEEISSTSRANIVTIKLGPMLAAGAVTVATLIIFILAAYIRKRIEMSKPQLHVCPDNEDPGSKVTEDKCENNGGKNDKRSSEGTPVTNDHLRPTSTAPGVKCSVSIPIYENLPDFSGAGRSRHSPADQQNIDDTDDRIYITPLPFAASERTEPPSTSLWFGLDVTQINNI